MAIRLPTSLQVTVPAVLLGLAVILSAVNALYNLPEAERAAQAYGRKQLAEELSRLQSTLEYQLLRGDVAAAQHAIAVLAHNQDYRVAALTDDRQVVLAATRRVWFGQSLGDVMTGFDAEQAGLAARQRRTIVSLDRRESSLVGYAGIQLPGDRSEIRSTRAGGVVLVFDLEAATTRARAGVIGQSLYWAGSVTGVAVLLWLAFHFLLARRTTALVRAAERLAAGDLGARSGLRGRDELGRLGRAFDSMAERIEASRRLLLAELAERERSQAALAVSEASYRAIFEASEDAIFVHEIETGAIVDANPKACQAFGYSAAELRRLQIGMLGSGVAPYTQDDALAVIRRAAAGERLSLEWHGRRRDGSLHWDEIFVQRVTLGGRDRILAIARDITDRKAAAEAIARQREELHQREKLAALGSLLAGVAHELNNPLSVVVARAVLLEEQGAAGTKLAAQRIRAAAERCARIVRTFLAMARRQQPERRPVVIAELVSAALEIAGYGLRNNRIDVETRIAHDLPPMLADADQLHQVLLNLIINAQQAMAGQAGARRLTVRACRERAWIVVEVEDNGPGVDAASRGRIFEPYFTTKANGQGTGVGLAISQGIVESHGGALTQRSAPGGGAVFRIELPADDEVATTGGSESLPAALVGSAEPVPVRTDAAASLRVLVVDDEEEIRDALATILGGAGHHVSAVSSGREAMVELQRSTVDVIVTDMRMPEIDGPALYRAIEERWPALAARCVFLTGDTLTSEVADFLRRTQRPVIEKPFLPADVRSVVARQGEPRAAPDTSTHP